MMRSSLRPEAFTAAYGGSGGKSFTFSKEGENLFSIELRCGDTAEQFVQGLVVTLTDGSSATFGSVRAKGQIAFKADFQLNEFVNRIVMHQHQSRCGGVVIETNIATHELGHLLGSPVVMNFHQAKLVGVRGQAGADLDRLGFIYQPHDEKFFYPRALPEQRFMWKSNSGMPILTTSMHRPFQTIRELDLTLEGGEVVGIHVQFSNGATQSQGAPMNDESVKIPFSSNALINEAAVFYSPNDVLAGLGFRFGRRDSQAVNQASEDIGQVFSDINGQLIAVQSGWTENGRVNALSLLFSSPCQRHTLGQLTDPEGSMEDFENVAMSRLLHSVFGFSNANILLGIGFSFTDKLDIMRGSKTTDIYSSAVFPVTSRTFKVQSKNGEGSNSESTAAIQFEAETLPSEAPWSAFVGQRILDGGRQMTVHGAFVGAWGASVDNVFSFGLVSTLASHFTPLCGRPDGGVFYETECMYSLNRQQIMGSLISIRVWWNKQKKILNGIQVKQASSESNASFITDIGTLSGDSSNCNLPEDFRVTELEASISPFQNGRVSGIRIAGLNRRNVRKEFTLGKLNGNVYHHEFEAGVLLIGLYGTCHNNHPSSIGFVVDPNLDLPSE